MRRSGPERRRQSQDDEGRGRIMNVGGHPELKARIGGAAANPENIPNPLPRAAADKAPGPYRSRGRHAEVRMEPAAVDRRESEKKERKNIFEPGAEVDGGYAPLPEGHQVVFDTENSKELNRFVVDVIQQIQALPESQRRPDALGILSRTIRETFGNPLPMSEITLPTPRSGEKSARVHVASLAKLNGGQLPDSVHAQLWAMGAQILKKEGIIQGTAEVGVAAPVDGQEQSVIAAYRSSSGDIIVKDANSPDMQIFDLMQIISERAPKRYTRSNVIERLVNSLGSSR